MTVSVQPKLPWSAQARTTRNSHTCPPPVRSLAAAKWNHDLLASQWVASYWTLGPARLRNDDE